MQLLLIPGMTVALGPPLENEQQGAIGNVLRGEHSHSKILEERPSDQAFPSTWDWSSLSWEDLRLWGGTQLRQGLRQSLEHSEIDVDDDNEV